MKSTRLSFWALPALLVLASIGARAEDPKANSGEYKLKAPDVAVPSGVDPGRYRRIVQPFPNWNLICDENLQERRKVCNISQSFINRDGRLVFSWSLAATEKGKPYMVLRLPPEAGSDASVSLLVGGKAPPVNVPTKGCNETVCVGYVPVGPRLRQAIEQEQEVKVEFATTTKTVSLSAPLAGLAMALSAIN